MSAELRRQAIRLLARREHTRAELRRKLTALGTGEEIDAVLAELEAAHLQSDQRYAEAYLRGHAARFGAARLRQSLRTRGLSDEIIESELREAALPDELQRARDVWRRKFSAVPGDAREWARQARFLQGRGFATDTIRRLLKSAPDEDAS